ncbi:MAG: CPCC family cysteine-rich protein [Eubacteriales bacterium]|nr:CPCC family cysteine-rich protein [Eubacteriales bacterium]
MNKKKYLCPCCKKYVFAEGPGSYEICPVCSWEDDKIQAENPDYKGGANKLSLNECIKKFNSVLALFLTIAVFIAGLAGLSGCGTASGSTANTSANAVITDAQESTTKVSTSDNTQTRTYTFRNQKLLNSHYEKHGKDMGFSSAKEYEKAASAVVTNPDALHKTEAEDGDDVYYVESTNEFVIVSTDGYIRTYFNPDAGIAYYNRQ